MDGMLLVTILSRWVHVGTAIVLVGGTVFFRFVLIPAAEKLSSEAHESLRGHLLNIWKWFVHGGIVLFILSGFYNYLVVSLPAHKGQGLYHGLLGTKILLAFIVFFLASVLVGRIPAFEGMRQKRKLWLGVIVFLATVIVAISGFVKVYPWPKPETKEETRGIPVPVVSQRVV